MELAGSGTSANEQDSIKPVFQERANHRKQLLKFYALDSLLAEPAHLFFLANALSGSPEQTAERGR